MARIGPWTLIFLAVTAAGSAAGCLNVRAPDVRINADSERHAPIDATRVPSTTTHEECRTELTRAYQEIDYLQRKVVQLQDDIRKLKRDRDEYKDKYKREKKKYDD